LNFPLTTFGIIVLNGEPFTRYCLKSIYPFAYEIIAVEGASPKAASIATQDGHSSDGTLEALYRFKEKEDPEGKLTIVTAEDHGYPDGFWQGEKDEQSRAYTMRATGDYVWQVDIDEFYHSEDMWKILTMLSKDPSISGVSFHWINFWGSFEYQADGWVYRDSIRKMNGNRRIFKWGKDFDYISHRPPTVIDEQGRDLCEIHWIGSKKSGRMGFFCYHYGMIFPKQAEQKTLYYKKMWENHTDMEKWHDESFNKLIHPFRILHGTPPPSWLKPFKGRHPEKIEYLINHLNQGTIPIIRRSAEDLEELIGSFTYRLATLILDLSYPFIPRLKSRIYKLLKDFKMAALRRHFGVLFSKTLFKFKKPRL